MTAQSPEGYGDEELRRTERAQDFLDTHLGTELPPAEYVVGEFRKWAESDGRQPFWLRTEGDMRSWALGGEIHFDYMRPSHADGKVMPTSYGKMILGGRTVRVMLPDPDSAELEREAVQVSETRRTFVAIADALEMVEGNFAQKLADAQTMTQLEEMLHDEN